MADVTKDIWNDDDGAEAAKPKKRTGLRRFLTFLLVLVAVLAIVLVAAWRDGTGVDALQRFFSYGKSDVVSGQTVYEYDISAQNRFALLEDSLVVASDTGVRLLDQQGTELWAKTVNLPGPALVQGGDRVAAYGVGGTNLFLLGREGELLYLSANEEEPFVAANLNNNGWLTVTQEKRTYRGHVSVYNAELDLVFALDSSSRFVLDARMLDDNKTLAVVTLGQEDGGFVSNVVLYRLDADGKNDGETENGQMIAVEPVADYDVENGLVMAIGQQGKQIVTVSDTCLTFADPEGKVTASVPYGNDFLRGYTLEGDGFATLLLNRYQSGSVGRLQTIGSDGAVIATLEVTQEVMDLSAAGRYLAVLYADSLVIYNQELQVYASLQGTDFATGVLVQKDGSALLLSADNASVFLP